MTDDLRDGLITGPNGPLRDMGVYEAGTGSGVATSAGDGSGPMTWTETSGLPRARVTSEAGDVAGVLNPLWRTGTVVGMLGLAIGLLMIIGTSGLAAVVLWPLGALSIITGTSVLWATREARRASRNMSVHVAQVHVTRTWQ